MAIEIEKRIDELGELGRQRAQLHKTQELY
jgi:hypothetical protein